jgi:hypothetical protein
VGARDGGSSKRGIVQGVSGEQREKKRSEREEMTREEGKKKEKEGQTIWIM